jgi:hypothetical protein
MEEGVSRGFMTNFVQRVNSSPTFVSQLILDASLMVIRMERRNKDDESIIDPIPLPSLYVFKPAKFANVHHTASILYYALDPEPSEIRTLVLTVGDIIPKVSYFVTGGTAEGLSNIINKEAISTSLPITEKKVSSAIKTGEIIKSIEERIKINPVYTIYDNLQKKNKWNSTVSAIYDEYNRYFAYDGMFPGQNEGTTHPDRLRNYPKRIPDYATLTFLVIKEKLAPGDPLMIYLDEQLKRIKIY